MNGGLDSAARSQGHGPNDLEVTTMTRVNNQSRTILACALVSLIASVVLSAPQTLAATTGTQDDSGAPAAVRGEHHRHGPPGKGFFHSHPTGRLR